MLRPTGFAYKKISPLGQKLIVIIEVATETNASTAILRTLESHVPPPGDALQEWLVSAERDGVGLNTG